MIWKYVSSRACCQTCSHKVPEADSLQVWHQHSRKNHFSLPNLQTNGLWRHLTAGLASRQSGKKITIVANNTYYLRYRTSSCNVGNDFSQNGCYRCQHYIKTALQAIRAYCWQSTCMCFPRHLYVGCRRAIMLAPYLLVIFILFTSSGNTVY